MEKVNIHNALEQVRFHGRILLNGLFRTIHGTLIAGLVAMAIYGFVSIPNEDGYTAAFDFVASVATLLVALFNMYFLGRKKRGGKR